MKQINYKNAEEYKNENHLKLLGKKTIRFRVKKNQIIMINQIVKKI